VKLTLIVGGVIFIIAAILVPIADKVNLLGFINVTSLTVRYVITAGLAGLGIVALLFGVKTRANPAQ
jgi:hypothetical protein